MKGLEPPRLSALEPKSRASTNSATFAWPPDDGLRGHSRSDGRRRPQTPNAAANAGKEKGTWAFAEVPFDLVGRQGFEPWTY